jgi:two-component system, OmpR family, sensor histidine kinase SenX3
MRFTRRAKKIAFFVVLGAYLVGLTLALNISWIVLNWREVVPLVLGIIFFGLIIAGLVVYSVFLVREIHKGRPR